MPEMVITLPPPPEIALPPTQDELPYSDGVPMESWRHKCQMDILVETLTLHWQERENFFIGGDMFVYFSLEQVRNYDFRGPDFFVVLDVPRGERKSWVVWEENKGPDLIIELVSESTAETDKVDKKRIYQERLRVPEYFWYDPFTAEWAGFRLVGGQYEEIVPDDEGRLFSEQTGLYLARWQGTFRDIETAWLRWQTTDGVWLPTSSEQAEAEHKQAEVERQRAEAEKERAELEKERADALEALLARYREQFGELGDDG